MTDGVDIERAVTASQQARDSIICAVRAMTASGVSQPAIVSAVVGHFADALSGGEPSVPGCQAKRPAAVDLPGIALALRKQAQRSALPHR